MGRLLWYGHNGTGDISVPELEDLQVRDQRDGERYRIIQLADSCCWLAENLRFETPPAGLDTASCWTTTGPAPGGGRLYTWRAAKIAARDFGEGWRLPSMTDWRRLAASLTGHTEAKMNLRRGAWRDVMGNHWPQQWRGLFWSADARGSLWADCVAFAHGPRRHHSFRGVRRNGYAVRLVCGGDEILRES